MMIRCLSALILLLWSAGCSRQHNQQPVSALPGVRGAATTASAAVSPASSNPELVEAPLPSVQATSPNESSHPASVQASQVPAVGQSATTQPPATIPAGTRIRVRLGRSLDTRFSRPGERFEAYLDDPVTRGDRVVVPKGTVFEGHVIQAKSSGRLKGRAFLGITLDSFRLHGATYRIATGADVRSSKSHKRRNLAMIGGGSGTGAAIGALAGGGVGALVGAGAGAAAGTTGAFITGRKNVRLPVETPMVFSLRASVTVRG
jgi:hypothetical protein